MTYELHERRMFIDHQASYDLAIGCLSEAHTWEALREAVYRAQDSLLVPVPLPPATYAGLSFA